MHINKRYFNDASEYRFYMFLQTNSFLNRCFSRSVIWRRKKNTYIHEHENAIDVIFAAFTIFHMRSRLIRRKMIVRKLTIFFINLEFTVNLWGVSAIFNSLCERIDFMPKYIPSFISQFVIILLLHLLLFLFINLSSRKIYSNAKYARDQIWNTHSTPMDCRCCIPKIRHR